MLSVLTRQLCRSACTLFPAALRSTFLKHSPPFTMASADANPQRCFAQEPTMTTVSLEPDDPHAGNVIRSAQQQPIALPVALPHHVRLEPPPAIDPAVISAKSAVRASMGRLLAGLSAESVAAASAALLARLEQNPLYQRASALCLFVSMPSGEVQTRLIIEHALSAGKKVFVPRIEPQARKPADAMTPAQREAAAALAASGMMQPAVAPSGGRMRMLQIHSVHELDSFPPNRWGIREPPLTLHGNVNELRLEAHNCADLSLLICPGVAFDSQRRRLGHGKGYYDTYLASLTLHRASQSLSPARTIAIAFDEQIIDKVPVGALDIQIDEVLTPTHHFTSSSSST